MRRKNQKGFTLMELMVVIVIVAILAAVAVPLYINYVRDAKLTEAKGAIGAIVSAQQAYYQKSAIAGPGTYAPDLGTLKSQRLLDIPEAEAKWIFQVTQGDTSGFTVTAAAIGSPGDSVSYFFTRIGGGNFSR